MTTAILAFILSCLGMLGAGLVAYTKIVQHLTRLEAKFDQSSKLAAHVPGLYVRTAHIEAHLGISPPEMPIFFNGHAE